MENIRVSAADASQVSLNETQVVHLFWGKKKKPQKKTNEKTENARQAFAATQKSRCLQHLSRASD